MSETEFRAAIYMAAVCRCFPGKTAVGGDRVPDAQEILNCARWLEAEIALLQPALIIPIGKLAIQQFVAFDKLTDVIGRQLPVTYRGHAFDIIPLPHPSGASPWHRMEPGRTLLGQALKLIIRHPAWPPIRVRETATDGSSGARRGERPPNHKSRASKHAVPKLFLILPDWGAAFSSRSGQSSLYFSAPMPKKPVVLIIRDGWGINPGGREKAAANGDATLLASTPFHEHLYATYPQATLSACGMDVGLPAGQMGNSEVGHLNLGAGRIVYQDLTRINKAIIDGELKTNAVLQAAFAKARGHRLHFLGLVSDGGVHSHQDHLIALAAAAKDAGVEDIMVHAITDGRDTSPTGGADFLEYVEAGLRPSGARIATVIGRYFAMDRDQRWERNKLAWDAIVLGRGAVSQERPSAAVRAAYAVESRGDEFLQPIVFSHANEQRVRDGDVVLWFNFRADRARQLSIAFLRKEFVNFVREITPAVHYVTLTDYDKTYGCPVAFLPQSFANILGAVVSAAGLKQLRIAETEKYPHVTFFFNGGIEEPFPGEDRFIVPSPKDVPTYDFKPEMSAPEVTARVVAALPDYDLVILNFANPDMVGHTGVVEAGIKAVETIDGCVRQVVEKTLTLGGQLLITADHGNCEQMRNTDGSPNTAHTTNLVHFLHVAAHSPGTKLESGILADVAPTLLRLLGVAKPAEMTGRSLVG